MGSKSSHRSRLRTYEQHLYDLFALSYHLSYNEVRAIKSKPFVEANNKFNKALKFAEISNANDLAVFFVVSTVKNLVIIMIFDGLR